MALGATTYTSVTWTTGDTITETKLDNMVANDQAYDSHAANGYLSNNNIGFYQKDSGGTNRAVANVDTNDILTLGDANLTENAVKTLAKFSAKLSADQSNISNATWTTLAAATEEYDVGGDYNNGTYQFTTPVAGYYFFIGSVMWKNIDNNVNIDNAIYNVTDTTNVQINYSGTASSTYNTLVVVSQAYLAASKAIDFRIYHGNGDAVPDVHSAVGSFFQGHLLSI